ncbi:MAG: AAC(3) family N-acetyltransferase [Candidatus Latescibacterota bacterium]
MLRRAARLLLPPSVHGRLRGWAQERVRRRRQGRPPIGEREFACILREELALGPGDTVFVHASLDELHLSFPFYRVLPLLRQAVGPEGTLLFPGTQLVERPETWLARGEVFDVRRTPTSMGIVAELARRQPGAVRSAHPTSAVTGLGPRAAELLAGHAESVYPWGPGSPLAALARAGGRIVGIGVGVEVLTFVHCVEDLWGPRFPVQTRCSRVWEGRVRRADGRECTVPTLVAHPRIWWRHTPRYVRRHVPAGVLRSLVLRGAPFYRADAGALLARMEELAAAGTTIYNRLVYRGSPVDGVMTWIARRAG